MNRVPFFTKVIFISLFAFSMVNCTTTEITEEGIEESNILDLDGETRRESAIDKEEVKIPPNG